MSEIGAFIEPSELEFLAGRRDFRSCQRRAVSITKSLPGQELESALKSELIQTRFRFRSLSNGEFV